MTFEEWWTQAVIEWEIPKSGAFYPLIKMATWAAWKTAHREGSMETTRFMTQARKEEEEEAKP